MDGKAAANFSSCPSGIIIIKVYGESETQSTQHRRLSSASHARRAGTREHSSRYHDKNNKKNNKGEKIILSTGKNSAYWM